MYVGEIIKIQYTKFGASVLINDELIEYPINHMLVEAWRNLGNEVLPYELKLEEVYQEKLEEIKELRDIETKETPINQKEGDLISVLKTIYENEGLTEEKRKDDLELINIETEWNK